MNGVQQAELAASRKVEVTLPLVQTLQTVHHAAIITVGGRCDEARRVKMLRRGLVIRKRRHTATGSRH